MAEINWSIPGRIESLREKWRQGKSSAVIGRELTAEFGESVSKNAVIGKKNRLELDSRPSPIGPREIDQEKISKAEALRRDGATTWRIAQETGLHANTVEKILGLRPSVLCSPRQTLPPLPSDAQVAGIVRMPESGYRPAAIAQAVIPRPAPLLPVMQKPLPVSLVPLRAPVTVRSGATCQWPIGEPGTKAFRFCDDASMAGKPYCCEHAKLAYVRIRDRKEDVAA